MVMSIQDAVQLIATIPLNTGPTTWVDLGAGTGTFTKALAQILPKDSTIYAIDQKKRDLRQIPDIFQEVNLIKQKGDFTALAFPDELDGFMMANALHYVREKTDLLERLQSKLIPGGHCLIIEYDTRKANPWVPYPIPFLDLASLLEECGFKEIRKIGTRPSIYGNGMIYAASAKKG